MNESVEAVSRHTGARVRSRNWASGAVATVSAALAHVPENAAYGLMAMAPLGLAFGPTAMALAVLGAVIANTVAHALGAGRLASGPRSSLALLTAGLMANLVTSPLATGELGVLQVLICVAVAVVCAGLLQALFGALGVGNLVKFTPYPVRLGLTSGIGLLLLLAALPVLLGQRFGTPLMASGLVPNWGAAGIGACALATSWLAARRIPRLPPVLLGMIVATAVHQALLASGGDVATWGHTLGVPHLPAIDADALTRAGVGAFEQLDAETVLLLAIYAVTLALLSSMDTLITVSIIDGRLRLRRSADRELVAQGLANVAAALCGGHASSASTARTLGLVLPQPQVRHASLAYAMVMLGVLLGVPQWLAILPESALGGLLVLQGAQMVAPALWRAPEGLLRLGRSRSDAARGEARTLAGNWAVTMVVAVSALLSGLGAAVLIGASFAVLLFVRSNMRDVVGHLSNGETRSSMKVRPAQVRDALRREGHRIALFELEGALFFGTADALQSRLQQLPDTVGTAILDLRQVQDIDVTAARILTEEADAWGRNGRWLTFAEWPAGDSRRQLLEAVVDAGSAGHLHFSDDVDRALEQAEDRLIEGLEVQVPFDEDLPLADTALMSGLTPHTRAVVASRMQVRQFPRGAVIFRMGDPGDGLFVVTRGEVGLRLPGSSRRLASFAAGVTIGEIAVLSHETRSAEAIAESDVTAHFLPTTAFDRLLVEHPDVAALLLKNMALHLSDRVRGLTGDLSYWVSRAAAKRPPTEPPDATTHSDEVRMTGE
jgi:sulfate permease, SulP family